MCAKKLKLCFICTRMHAYDFYLESCLLQAPETFQSPKIKTKLQNWISKLSTEYSSDYFKRLEVENISVVSVSTSCFHNGRSHLAARLNLETSHLMGLQCLSLKSFFLHLISFSLLTDYSAFVTRFVMIKISVSVSSWTNDFNCNLFY